MRKVTALLLVFTLLALSACTGVESFAPTPTPRPTVTRSPLFPPTPTPVPTLAPTVSPVLSPIVFVPPDDLPDYIPPLDFEVASVWRAEPYSAQGDAVLFMSEPVNGKIRFKIYAYNFLYEDTPNESLFMREITADTSFDGTVYPFTALVDRGPILTGEFTRSEDSLSFAYFSAYEESAYFGGFIDDETAPGFKYITDPSMEEVMYLPTSFTRVSEEDSGQVMYQMPMFRSEVLFPTYRPEMEQYYPFVDDPERTTIFSSNPDYIAHIRGVEIGDSLMEVLAKFLCKEDQLNTIGWIENEEYVVLLYGGGGMSFMGKIIYNLNNTVKAVNYSDGRWVSFLVDENLKVNEIRAYELH